MATVQHLEWTDDIDGKTPLEAHDAVGLRFGFNGFVYELDTTRQRADALEKLLAVYIGAARKVGKLPAGPYLVDPRTDQQRDHTKTVRAWAIANGWPLSDRGRIPREVVLAYQDAQEAKATAPAPKAKAKRATQPKAATPVAQAKRPARPKATPKAKAAPATSAVPDAAPVKPKTTRRGGKPLTRKTGTKAEAPTFTAAAESE